MKKTKMEDELRALSNILDLHGVDMNTPLLTPGGFPRADIDVPQSMYFGSKQNIYLRIWSNRCIF